ncbi:MAG: 6-phosphogluconolactonase [Patescibacteria group bacterium]
MNFPVIEKAEVSDVARFIASSVLKNLEENKKVLLFLTGGSSVPVGVEVLRILNISKTVLDNLTVTLTDERYGDVGHADSNWHKLLEKGVDFSKIKTITVLRGEDFENTVGNFARDLERVLVNADFKIGLFGIGKDMHTAGILPGSASAQSLDFVCGYNTAQFSRITITPKAIAMLDEAVVCLRGEEKREVVEHLRKENDINIEPAQILKKVSLLTVFTNYEN